MNTPNFYITEENFKSLIGPGYWKIEDLPHKHAEQVKPFLGNGDTIGVFASGTPPQGLTGSGKIVAGIDWVRLESNRKVNEPPLNIYHFIIKEPDKHGYPVFACKEGKSIGPHWSELEDLNRYWT
ncbi:hypothetical protein K2X85_16180 [bacterium]|nr:hypothetical protein [bacterium]